VSLDCKRANQLTICQYIGIEGSFFSCRALGFPLLISKGPEPEGCSGVFGLGTFTKTTAQVLRFSLEMAYKAKLMFSDEG
jgi:hypothetical protein